MWYYFVDDLSLAKLKMQYESEDASFFTQSLDTKEKGLLGALTQDRVSVSNYTVSMSKVCSSQKSNI